MNPKKKPTASESLVQAQLILMEKEVVSRTRHPVEFRLVNNQYNQLQNWHDQYTGWRIRRSPAVIRLVRTPAAFIPGYIFSTLQHPRDFACFVWTLWYFETRLGSGRGNEQQFLMSQLAERLEEHSVTGGYLAPHAAGLDFKRQADRYSFVRAIKALQELGGVQLVDGSSEEWVSQSGQEDALWEFTEVARSLILALDREEFEAAGRVLDGNPHSLRPTLLPGADKLSPLQRAWRTLLLGPVLLKYDDPAAFAALKEHQESINFELGATFGWQLDMRYEYAMVIRASGTGLGPVTLLNLNSSFDQAALLCCTVLRQKIVAGTWSVQPIEGCYVLPESELAEIFRQVREEYGTRWGSTARKTSFPELLREVYATMRQAGLIRGPDRSGNILVLPTVARFAVSYPPELDENEVATSAQANPAQLSLLETETSAKVATENGTEKYYSTGEAVKEIGVSRNTVLSWLNVGTIQGIRNPQGWQIPASEIERVKKLRGVN